MATGERTAAGSAAHAAPPLRGAVRALDAVYRLHQTVWSAWARRRYRAELDRVERFCLFVGYPRSGHSVVGALLNAHRDAVVSHELDAPRLVLAGCSREELYARILARAAWFSMRGDRALYPYRVPHQWQGRFEALRVIGDKRGGAVARCIAEHPGFLARVRSLTGVPLRLIHVVRDPFDNVAAISLRHGLTLEASVELYFAHCRTTAALDSLCAPEELITLHHERMIREPATVLAGLCAHLGLEPEAGYVQDCCSIVFEAPARTRTRVAWTPALVREVERRAAAYPFLDGYRFELPGRPASA